MLPYNATPEDTTMLQLTQPRFDDEGRVLRGAGGTPFFVRAAAIISVIPLEDGGSTVRTVDGLTVRVMDDATALVELL